MTSTTEKDPLEALEVDAEEMDRRSLAELLAGFVRIDSKRNAIVFLNGVRDVATNRQLAALAVLGQQAIHLRQPDRPEGLAPREISDATGVAGGSIRPAVKTLADEGLVVKDNGRYVSRSHAVEVLQDEFDALRENLGTKK